MIINGNKKIPGIFYSNGFSYDPENNWWYKYPLNYNEDSL